MVAVHGGCVAVAVQWRQWSGGSAVVAVQWWQCSGCSAAVAVQWIQCCGSSNVVVPLPCHYCRATIVSRSSSTGGHCTRVYDRSLHARGRACIHARPWQGMQLCTPVAGLAVMHARCKACTHARPRQGMHICTLEAGHALMHARCMTCTQLASYFLSELTSY